MQQLYFSIRPDITSQIRFLRIEFFGYSIVGGVSLTIALIYSIKYLSLKKREELEARNYKEFLSQLHNTYHTKLHQLKGKEFIKYLIHYLETFVITWNYRSIKEIIWYLWLNDKEIEHIHQMIYHQWNYDPQLEIKLKNLIGKIS